jgi:DNA-binding XRE family transcriptional regulator
MPRTINKNNRIPRRALIARRELLGITRPTLAKILGLSRSYIFRVELGEIDPDFDKMTAWLDALGDGATPALFGHHRNMKWAGLEPTEDQTTAAILQHWKALGVPGSLVASIPNKGAHGQAGLTRGLPDLLVISPKLGAATGYIELKRGNGKARMSAEQKTIRDLLIERGAPYALTRGRDEPIKILEAWGAVRPARAA